MRTWVLVSREAKGSDPPGAGAGAIGSLLTWIRGSELRSSGRAGCVPNSTATSPASRGSY